MKYVTSIERSALREGMHKFIETTLQAKFGQPDQKLLRKIQMLTDVEDLVRFTSFLATASTLKEVRDYFK